MRADLWRADTDRMRRIGRGAGRRAGGNYDRGGERRRGDRGSGDSGSVRGAGRQGGKGG